MPQVRRYVAELHSAYLFKSAPVKDVRESVQERGEDTARC